MQKKKNDTMTHIKTDESRKFKIVLLTKRYRSFSSTLLYTTSCEIDKIVGDKTPPPWTQTDFKFQKKIRGG